VQEASRDMKLTVRTGYEQNYESFPAAIMACLTVTEYLVHR